MSGNSATQRRWFKSYMVERIADGRMANVGREDLVQLAFVGTDGDIAGLRT